MGTSLVVHWLRLHASNAGGMGSIPGGGTKIPHAMWHGQKEKKKGLNKTYYENEKYIYIGKGQVKQNQVYFFSAGFSDLTMLVFCLFPGGRGRA